MHVTTPSGAKQYSISSVDVYTQQAWTEAYTSLSAANAKDLLYRIYEDIKPEQIQADGGSEFRGCYGKVCKHFGMRLIVLPPNSPELKGHIESPEATLVREPLNFKGVSDNLRADRAKPQTIHLRLPRGATSQSSHTQNPNAWMKLVA